MRLILLVLLLLLLPNVTQAQDSPRGDAFKDPRAEELVRLARQRRNLVDRRITRYEVEARERISVHMVIAGFERLFFRRETAARIDWSPDTVSIHVIGAREVQPFMNADTRLPPSDLPGYLTSLAFDPVDPEMLFRIDSTAVWHPLNSGSEAHYRFASGDTTTIRLPDGRAIQLLELRVTARRPAPTFINGSLWLDAETHGMVRAVVRLSRPFSTARGLYSLLPEVAAELDQVSIDYGLRDLRWWLPRTIVGEGQATVAGTRFPFAYERVYSDYLVEGDTTSGARVSGSLDGLALERPCRPESFGSITVSTSAPADSTWAARWDDAAETVLRGDSTKVDDDPCDRAFLVTADPVAGLLESPVFTAGIYAPGDLVEAAERAEIAALVRRIPQNPVRIQRPVFQLLTPPDLLHANRVEGISGGARAIMSLGSTELRTEGRIGTTDELGLRAAVARPVAGLRVELGGYRRVEAVDFASNPFAISSSVSSVLFGRDENDYFRGTGLELRIAPVGSRQPWDVRLFGERQQALQASSRASLRGLLDSEFEPRPNIPAEALTQAGAVLRMRGALGSRPEAGRLRSELTFHGETGDLTFGRPMLRVEGDLELGRSVGFAFSLAAGTAFGEAPVQRHWQIGGSNSVRGHDTASARGESVWLGRGELSFGSTFLGFKLFGDAGWAGERGAFGSGKPLTSAGAGASLMGGLLRVDVARGFGEGGGTRVYLRLGGGI